MVDVASLKGGVGTFSTCTWYVHVHVENAHSTRSRKLHDH